MKTDIQLQQDVLEELRWEPSVNPAEIGVAAKDGVVTLTGFVNSFGEKLTAEKATKRVQGVKAVAEEIEVRIPSMLKRTDADIARAALNALQWNTLVPDDRVTVKVEDGWVTLEGELDWGFQRDAAMEAVHYLTGVRGVTNLITVKPRVEPKEIKAKIAEAFKRSAELDANRIKVEALGGKVTLSGSVHSWVERDEAGRAAWAAPGVSAVDNHISVSP
jgi:osmotically-inducible protein OsmY